MYLHGIEFEVVVDHQPLVSLYRKNGPNIPTRVARHKDKLTAFNFTVLYEPGSKNPCDYMSRQKHSEERYSQQQKEELGVEEEEEDAEIIIHKVEELREAITINILQHQTGKDDKTRQLMDNIMTGRLSQDIPNRHKYKQVFHSLEVNQGMIMRENRILIPEACRVEVLAAAHEGHPSSDSMLRQLRSMVWWPEMDKDVRDYVNTCNKGCVPASSRTVQPPMRVRDTPRKPWEQVAANFKGPIGGKYYFHTTIDLYSRWPEVEVVKPTSFDELERALNQSFALHGIPDSITHDNGPCYNGHRWKNYVTQRKMELWRDSTGCLSRSSMQPLLRVKTPEWRSIGDSSTKRNTPHKTTGVSPSMLMMNRQVRRNIPSTITNSTGKHHKKARENDEKARMDRKEKLDKKKNAREQQVEVGDKVLLSQKKTSIASPFDPNP